MPTTQDLTTADCELRRSPRTRPLLDDATEDTGADGGDDLGGGGFAVQVDRAILPRSLYTDWKYRTELIHLINLEHPLARLGRVVQWERFDEAFTPLYDPGNGRPGIPTRLMVGLHYLKHLYQLSDEDVVAQWVENLYWQYLCGSKYFEHELPIHATSMTRWRKKIEVAGAEQMLAETIAAGLDVKAIRVQSLRRVVVDTTVQERWRTRPTPSCMTT